MAGRKIIHLDMDSFYASVEMRANPDLRTKPLVIGRDPRHSGGKGVVATANYVARAYGIHSAMPTAKALELCPQAVFKKPDFDKYRQVSNQIHQLFHSFTDKIEPVALDEAYLDVTENKRKLYDEVQLAHLLQQEIYEQTHLTSSVGISYNKFLAKLASDYNKPVGLTVIKPADVESFLFPLPIEKFRGVGQKTVLKMHELGIYTGADLFAYSDLELVAHFGKIGHFFYQCVRGIDDRPVEWQRKRKSVGRERTFDSPLTTTEEVAAFLKQAANQLVVSLEAKQLRGKTLVLKVRNSDYETITKRVSQAEFFQNDASEFAYQGQKLFEQIQQDEIDVRLLGLTMTNLAKSEETVQLSLWD